MIKDNGYADLHIHSNRSDGYYAPKELIEKVAAQGLKATAVVDHDDISAYEEACFYGKKFDIEVLTGVELSVSYDQHDLHILGYDFDYLNQELSEYLTLFKEHRISRAQKIVENLANLGMPISFEAVLEKAGRGTVGRPHIASVLVEDGFVYSFQEAFNKYLGEDKPAHVAKYKMELATALNLVKTAGGICCVAHPGLRLKQDDLLILVQKGISGIEVIHPNHNEESVNFFRDLAKKYNLVATGGSDFHGGGKNENSLGKFKVPYDVVLQIKEKSVHHDGLHRSEIWYDN